jgi:NADH-quinone oxidoreductase subunit H
LSQEALNVVAILLNIAVVVGATLGTVPFIVLFERKIIGWVQERPGPNRAGPWGILQGIADGIKLFFKETLHARGVDKGLYYLAPLFSVVPALLLLSILPFAPPWVGMPEGSILHWVMGWISYILGYIPIVNNWYGGEPARDSYFHFTIASDLNVSLLFYFAVTSLSIFGVTLAGWASNNKYSLLGGIRSAAQMVSYELVLGLSAVGAILLSAGSLNLQEIILHQTAQGLDAAVTAATSTEFGRFFPVAGAAPEGWMRFADLNLWHYNIWAQPIAFLLFLIGAFAETNRLPFDLPEAEAELTGGYHTEYSGIRFAMFFLAEYVHMIIVSSILVALYLGGWTNPFSSTWANTHWITGIIWFSLKLGAFLFLFIFIRAVLPRVRYDQLMTFGWKLLLPVAIANVALTAIAIPLFPRTHALVLLVINALVLYAYEGGRGKIYLAEERRREFRYVT